MKYLGPNDRVSYTELIISSRFIIHKIPYKFKEGSIISNANPVGHK